MKTLDKQNIWTIANWEKLHRLEHAMNQTRENYTKVFGDIHKVVRQRHPELNRLDTNFSANVIRSWGGQAAFSSSKWPSKYEGWPTGIYVWGISLDELTGEKQIEPAISIWVGTEIKKMDKRVEILRSRLAKRADKIFAGKNLQWKLHDDEDSRVCLIYPLPEDRSKLLDLLLKKDSKGFVDCMANHVSRMAAFDPIINEVLAK